MVRGIRQVRRNDRVQIITRQRVVDAGRAAVVA
jgi:hypothetical protein